MPTLHQKSQKVNLALRIYFLVNLSVMLLIGLIFYWEFKPSSLEITLFDIGQGDSILIKTPRQEYILVDGGPDNSVIYKLGEFLPFYQRKIDFVILTHPDADHLVGLIEVLRRYQVEYVITTDFIHSSRYFKAWLEALSSTQVLVVDEPKVLALGETKLYFINPLNKEAVKTINNSSIVFKLEYKNHSALFTGDFENEESLVDPRFDLKSDFLKVGHHGANNANDFEFLAQVNPKIAAISAGRNNKFGHPRPETIASLEKLGATIFRTDLQTDLKFTIIESGFEYQP